MTNTHNIEKDKNKDKYDETFINKWTNQMTQSDNKTISEMLCKLLTK